MQLQHIKTPACPECGAPVSAEGVEHDRGKPRVHTNGEKWETRTFACGLHIDWIPNFGREEHRGTCLQSPAYHAKVKERRQRMGALKATLDTWEDKSFATEVWSRISYLTPSDW